MQKSAVPMLLLVFYLSVFTACAVSPYDREVWWAENIPVMLVVLSLILITRVYRFSGLSYLLMSCFLILHTIGGHYTFERVPFDAVTRLFNFERNHYDRIAHFSVGFYAYPLAEVLLVKRLVNTRWIVVLFPLFAILAVAGLYEIFEWLYAVSADPAAGIAVLGSQGDSWDAQKDILADTSGAMFALALFYVIHRVPLQGLGKP